MSLLTKSVISEEFLSLEQVCGIHSLEYTCNCQEGWIGNNCEYECPRYNDNICNNNGVCAINEIENIVECICNNQLYGLSCEQDKCNNRGSWHNLNETCTCIHPYTGSNCINCIEPYIIDPIIDDKLENQLCILECENGFFDDLHNICLCEKNYTGELCETLDNSSLFHGTKLKLFIVCSAISLIIIGILVIYCYCCKYKKEKVDISNLSDSPRSINSNTIKNTLSREITSREEAEVYL